MIYSATGVAAAPSEELVATLKLELKALNEAGGIDGRPIEFVMADDGSDAQKGVVAATKLIQDDKVTAILGPFAMFVSSAVGMLAEKSQMPIIYLSPKSPGGHHHAEVGLRDRLHRLAADGPDPRPGAGQWS